ncbi:ketoacyl-ACP synthase III [Micromonospora sp. HUAS LYJ1]|uniref:ketoacyl-ACP synthase III n=1 Tax=Micromonospora sp. HUAS LYJ1 TaxID=3061626 RepID=UPI0026722B08|nr:ketoacyl-ACP synthase III [Micromonospora sp. HUAS LYJ1]WKU02988.1 ketoacyl-ACP synthase III [Micromonospora sp. HUAS LYJ1]
MRGVWAGAGIRLLGFGHYYPATVQPNPPEVAAEVGVRSRYVASAAETVTAMAVRATEAALRAAGTSADELDLLVLANCTTRRYFPETAPQVATELGSARALAFDVCGGCAGWVHGVQLAAALLRTTPGARRAVVVASEQFSRRGRPGSRSALVVGDAAGAVALGREAGAEDGLLDSVLHTSGGDADACVIEEENGLLRSRRAMVELARKTQLGAVDELLGRNGVTLHDIDWVVPHPGTHAVHTAFTAELDLADDRVVTNFATAGNTASATIPTTLSENVAIGRFRPGQLLLTPTAGAGWYSGGLLFRL